jgi:hypothetical protein
MKKTLSIIIAIVVIFMLEFNLLNTLIPQAYVWIEILLAFVLMAVLSIWNGIFKKNA